MKEESEKKRKRDKTILIATVISFVGNTIVIFGYFFPLEPMGTSIYFIWLTLGHVLFWLRLPKVADTMSWVRILRKWVHKLHERLKTSEGQATTSA